MNAANLTNARQSLWSAAYLHAYACLADKDRPNSSTEDAVKVADIALSRFDTRFPAQQTLSEPTATILRTVTNLIRGARADLNAERFTQAAEATKEACRLLEGELAQVSA